jgi:SAM-dependent methyltransferase
MLTIEQQLDSVISRFPPALARSQVADIPRMTFALQLVERACGLRGALCDIGGGQGLFAVACASLGMKVTMIDDFGDQAHQETGSGPVELYEQYGVHLINCDVVTQQLDFPESVFDVVTSFDSMEHWHHSPKLLFESVARAIKPGGAFILGVPNCVNLRKRITVPFGYGRWSSMADWYERPRFRGHVREPDVSDLRYIANDMGLVDVEISGRNWFAYEYPARLVRAFAPVIDHLIRPIPSLCASIYLVARKKR